MPGGNKKATHKQKFVKVCVSFLLSPDIKGLKSRNNFKTETVLKTSTKILRG